jgi:hypothetical protein
VETFLWILAVFWCVQSRATCLAVARWAASPGLYRRPLGGPTVIIIHTHGGKSLESLTNKARLQSGRTSPPDTEGH